MELIDRTKQTLIIFEMSLNIVYYKYIKYYQHFCELGSTSSSTFIAVVAPTIPTNDLVTV